jgi:CHAT domain-containing protein
VERDRLQSYRLPARSRIEAAVTRLLHEAGKPGNDAAAEQAASELGAMLLGPVQGHLGRKRLVVLADGAVQSVPFAVLRLPRRNVPLAMDHELVALPSASTLALRRKTASATCSGRQILVLSDPVFDGHDPRVPRSAGSSHLLTPFRLARLPYTRDEARAVTVAVRGSARVRTAEGFAAAKTLLTNLGSTCYRAVHIASHGIVNLEDPQQTGIVFSRVDAQGRPQDGFLRLPEIYNLTLPVESVVLSTCRSGLGQVVPGEGLAGMTRAFLYAGAARVIGAQWDVDDEATAALMARFYAYQFGTARMRAAAALRAAQMDIRRMPRWNSPYYWGGFVLHGEWR